MRSIFSLLVDPKSLPHPSDTTDFTHILNILFVVMGALAVLMVVIGGFRYTLAGGKPDDVATARRMIVYSIVGLIVIALAATIVNTVLNRI